MFKKQNTLSLFWGAISILFFATLVFGCSPSNSYEYGTPKIPPAITEKEHLSNNFNQIDENPVFDCNKESSNHHECEHNCDEYNCEKECNCKDEDVAESVVATNKSNKNITSIDATKKLSIKESKYLVLVTIYNCCECDIYREELINKYLPLSDSLNIYELNLSYPKNEHVWGKHGIRGVPELLLVENNKFVGVFGGESLGKIPTQSDEGKTRAPIGVGISGKNN